MSQEKVFKDKRREKSEILPQRLPWGVTSIQFGKADSYRHGKSAEVLSFVTNTSGSEVTVQPGVMYRFTLNMGRGQFAEIEAEVYRLTYNTWESSDPEGTPSIKIGIRYPSKNKDGTQKLNEKGEPVFTYPSGWLELGIGGAPNGFFNTVNKIEVV